MELSQNSKLSLEDFSMLCIIGKGSYAKVALVRKKANSKIYALKIIKKTKIKERNQKEHVFSEKEILAECNHPFIIKMISAFHNQKKLFFVLEYCPGGELFTLLKRKTRFNEQMTKFYSAQIVLALQYLHSKKIIYSDLKPENVLIDKEGYIRLTDFGLSTKNFQSKSNFMIIGTPEYLAPEVINRQRIGPEVDYWCLGTIIYEMTTGLPPFYDVQQTKQTLFERIKFEKPKLVFSMSQNLKDLLNKLLQKKPAFRLGSKGTESIKCHPWFSNVNWGRLLKKKHKAPFIPNIKSEVDVSFFDQEFTQNEILSADSYHMDSINSPNSDKTYKGFTYQNSNRSKSVKSNSPCSSVPSASPQNDSPLQFRLGIKQGELEQL